MVWIHNSRILAIFAVVFLHTAARVVVKNDIGSEYWWYGNIYDSIVRWCVPVFVMISGGLLLDPNKKESLNTFYRKRLAKILLPILFWSAFFLCWSFVKEHMLGNEPTVMDLLGNLIQGTPYYHFWFLYMILSLYLFTPFFRKIITHSSRKELKFLVIVMFLFSMVSFFYEKFVPSSPKLFFNLFLTFIPYYFSGYLICHNDYKPAKITLWVIFILSFILTSLGFYYVCIRNSAINLYFYGYLSITVIPMSICVMYLLKSWTSPIINIDFTKKLSTLSFGIYIIHPIIIDIISSKHIDILNYNPIITIPLKAIIVFIFSLAGAWIIHQIPYLKRTI